MEGCFGEFDILTLAQPDTMSTGALVLVVAAFSRVLFLRVDAHLPVGSAGFKSQLCHMRAL